ncbi:phosphotransferase [Leucobacter chromiireducens subsp. solipictus]|uniref:Phosphotransferase n=1 Tax=Leucobacter chromiireducens subsp. solipictus TaxID=398235 RepID=A0ABS1SMB5_9MICO|nr:phosphotransferase [Leucobacter chromiireducens subsp. solipictus]
MSVGLVVAAPGSRLPALGWRLAAGGWRLGCGAPGAAGARAIPGRGL